MKGKNRVALGALLAVLGVTTTVLVTSGSAATPTDPKLTNVATANQRAPGFAPASKLSTELAQVVVAQGSTLVENPSTDVSTYGYENDVVTSPGVPR